MLVPLRLNLLSKKVQFRSKDGLVLRRVPILSPSRLAWMDKQLISPIALVIAIISFSLIAVVRANSASEWLIGPLVFVGIVSLIVFFVALLFWKFG